MGRQTHDQYVTYTITIPGREQKHEVDAIEFKVRKFLGGEPREWLEFSYKFNTLATRKGWNDAQKTANLVLLIEDGLEADVQRLLHEANHAQATFAELYTSVAKLSVPPAVRHELEEELWDIRKRPNETVLQFSRRQCELVRMLAELPEDAKILPEAQQCRLLTHGMPKKWQCKLASSGLNPTSLTQLIAYFSWIESTGKKLGANEETWWQQRQQWQEKARRANSRWP